MIWRCVHAKAWEYGPMNPGGRSVEDMKWWAYVQQHGGENQAQIARQIGITPSSVGRWGKGSLPDPEQATKFAKAYGRPVLEAFVAAGILTPEEAGEKPSAPPRLESLSDDELLREVRRRMEEGGQKDDRQSGAEKSPDEVIDFATARQNKIIQDAQEASMAADEGDDPEGDQ